MSAILDKINKIVNDEVRPTLVQDGGDIDVVKFEDGKLYISLSGACYGCPYSKQTLQYGIEDVIKHHVPEVESVIQIDDEDDEDEEDDHL